MKVLIVGNVPRDLGDIRGGVQAVTMNLLEGLKSSPDMEIFVFSLNKGIRRPSTFPFSPHIRIFYFPYRGRSTKWQMLFQGRRQLKRLVDEIGPDIIHFQGSGSLLLLSLGLDKSKAVVTSHGILREEVRHQKSLKQTLSHLVIILIERLFLKRFRNVLFISDYSKAYYLRKKLIDSDKTFCRTINNPVSPAFFSADDPPPAVERSMAAGIVFIYVGRLIPLKGIDILIRSFEKAHRKGFDFRLNIIGGWESPRYERRIRKIVSQTGMEAKISFPGWQDQASVLAALQEASVFIFPSKHENLPVSVAEALSIGKTVVASNVGGIHEMITHGENGFLFSKADITALEGIILDVLEGRIDLVSLAQNARQRAKRSYHPHAVAKTTVDFYKAVIENAPPSPHNKLTGDKIGKGV